jgi:hypothetical protein
MLEKSLFTRFEGRVDAESGVITGVRLLTKGEAAGHHLRIDDATLNKIVELAACKSCGLKSKFNHRSGVESINGRFLNPRRVGDAVYADLHLDKTDASFAKMIYLAREQPENVGISLTYDDERQPHSNIFLSRPIKLYSADLVDDPAANPSLFEVPVDTPAKSMDETQLKTVLDALAEIKALCEENKAFIDALKAEMTEEDGGGDASNDGGSGADAGKPGGEEETASDAGSSPETAEEQEEEKTELAALRKKITQLEASQKALKEVLKGSGQKSATATSRTEFSAKTAEQTQLQAKLTAARTALEKAHGLRKVMLSGQYEKEFGKNWKTQLTELEAKK